MSTTILGSEAVTRLCRELGYSRAHVAKLLRENARRIGAKKRHGRWVLAVAGEAKLRTIVERDSGRRYKCGERGPHA